MGGTRTWRPDRGAGPKVCRLTAGGRWIRTIGYGDVSGRPPRARQRSSGSTPRSETSRLRSWEPTGPSTASTSHVYLAEFDYRFNRRYDLAAMMPRLCWVYGRPAPPVSATSGHKRAGRRPMFHAKSEPRRLTTDPCNKVAQEHKCV